MLRTVIHEQQLPALFFNGYPGYQGMTRHDLLAHYLDCQAAPDEAFDFTALANYPLMYGGAELRAVADNVCLMADPNLDFAFGNKAHLDDAFKHAALQQYRPRSMTFPRVYSPSLTNKIHRTISATLYVIKAPDIEEGKGIALVKPDELDRVLKIVLAPSIQAAVAEIIHQQLEQSRDKLEKFAPMLNSQSDRFMVEEYVASRPIRHHGQVFDGTVRSLFLYVRDQGVGRFVPIGAYWKLPPQPITAEQEPLASKTISSFSSEHILAQALDPQDLARINQVLADLVPRLLTTLIKTDYVDTISRIKGPLSPSFGQDVQWLCYVNALSLTGQAEMALHCLGLVKHQNIEAYRLSYYRAIAYYAKGDEAQAIQYLDEAIKLAPHYAPAQFRLARIYAERGDLASYQACEKRFKGGRSDPSIHSRYQCLEKPTPVFIAHLSSDERALTMPARQQQAEQYKDAGNAYFKQQKYERAIVAYEKAIALSPTYAVAWLNIARCHQALDNRVFAQIAFVEAIKHDRHYGKAYYGLIKFYYEQKTVACDQLAAEYKKRALRLVQDEAEKRQLSQLTPKSVSLGKHYASIWERKRVYAESSAQVAAEPEVRPSVHC